MLTPATYATREILGVRVTVPKGIDQVMLVIVGAERKSGVLTSWLRNGTVMIQLHIP